MPNQSIHTTIRFCLAPIEDVLRCRGWVVDPGNSRLRLLRLVAVVVGCGMWYGFSMGTFSSLFAGGLGTRTMQLVFSAVKVPILLLLTFAISMPSFFIVNTLFGLRDDFADAVRALVATQAGLTIVLAALSPFTLMWYASKDDYSAAIVCNVVMFGIASVAAQVLLRRYYRPLIEKDVRHRLLLRAWLVIYAFVGIQMGWTLRPFVGAPGSAMTFFRENAWGNAYIELWGIVVRVFGG